MEDCIEYEHAEEILWYVCVCVCVCVCMCMCQQNNAQLSNIKFLPTYNPFSFLEDVEQDFKVEVDRQQKRRTNYKKITAFQKIMGFVSI